LPARSDILSYLLKHHHITNGRLHNRPSLTIQRMLNVHIELCSGARLIRIKRSVAEYCHILQSVVSEVPHAGVGAFAGRRGTFDTMF
jgi:hypothetical protein